jgi:hypothetical protein
MRDGPQPAEGPVFPMPDTYDVTRIRRHTLHFTTQDYELTKCPLSEILPKLKGTTDDRNAWREF